MRRFSKFFNTFRLLRARGPRNLLFQRSADLTRKVMKGLKTYRFCRQRRHLCVYLGGLVLFACHQPQRCSFTDGTWQLVAGGAGWCDWYIPACGQPAERLGQDGRSRWHGDGSGIVCVYISNVLQATISSRRIAPQSCQCTFDKHDGLLRRDKLKTLSRQLATHVVGMRPENLNDLLNQPFVFDGSKTVAQVVSEAANKVQTPIKINGFVRYAMLLRLHY